MSRDPGKLKMFQLVDERVVEVCRVTGGFLPDERYGLQAQLRRGAVSVPTNLVEGCSRRSTKDYLHFVEISLGSASEVGYLLGLAHRLGFLASLDSEPLASRYGELSRGLQRLLGSLLKPRSLKPEACSRLFVVYSESHLDSIPA